MKAKLVHDTGRQRWYQLSEPIIWGHSDLSRDPENIRDTVLSVLEKRINFDNRDAIRESYSDGCMLVCISDAITHIERLAFPGYIDACGEYKAFGYDIAGRHTTMIYGGDPRDVYDDEVYLRFLCIKNNIKWEGFEK